MTTKEISFEKIKFPRETVEQALQLFNTHSMKKKKVYERTSLNIEFQDEKISHSDFPAFWISYSDEELNRASIHITSFFGKLEDEIRFRLSFSYEGDTTIEITLSDLHTIDEILDIFKKAYAKKSAYQKQEDDITFRVTRRLPSMEVNIKLITRIEEYLDSLQKKELFVKLTKARLSREISLYDENGVLSMPSIKKYSHEIFSDSIKKIDFDQRFGNSLVINLCFSNNQNLCEITIKAQGSDSKEITETVFTGIFDIFSDYRITVFAIKNQSLLNVLNLICLCYIIISYSIMLFSISAKLPFTLGASLIIISLFALDKIYPYISFNTKKNQKSKKVRSYIVYPIVLGVISSFVYDLVKSFFNLPK